MRTNILLLDRCRSTSALILVSFVLEMRIDNHPFIEFKYDDKDLYDNHIIS